MSEKKKPAAGKSNERRMRKPPVPKFAAPSEPKRAASSNHDGTAVVPQPLNSQKQLSSFDGAIKLFHARKFQEAAEMFHVAAAGPERDVAQRARLHIVMCERRLQQGLPPLETAEDHYNYGVALLNTRKVADARIYLEKALELEPGADHVHYALALAKALHGDVSGAAEDLRRAIEIEPRNRIIARQDVDFAPLANQPPFDLLLYPEKKNW